MVLTVAVELLMVAVLVLILECTLLVLSLGGVDVSNDDDDGNVCVYM